MNKDLIKLIDRKNKIKLEKEKREEFEENKKLELNNFLNEEAEEMFEKYHPKFSDFYYCSIFIALIFLGVALIAIFIGVNQEVFNIFAYIGTCIVLLLFLLSIIKNNFIDDYTSQLCKKYGIKKSDLK